MRSWRWIHRIGPGLSAASVVLLVWAAPWRPLADDGIHDPTAPGLVLLQEPAEALSGLPPDTTGNRVRWVRALDEGFINPRPTLSGEGELPSRTTDVIMPQTAGLPMVRFPHRVHTAWLHCSNCHDGLFEQVAGATDVTMAMILRGEKCGVCHGAVSFPLTECSRCHSVPRLIGTPGRSP